MFFRILPPLACLLGIALPVWAEPEIACPSRLSVTASAADMPGWRAVRRAEMGLPLERIAIRQAPDSAEDIPQTGFLRMEQGPRKTILARWDLAEARAAHPALWLVCFYAGTTISLMRELSSEVMSCEYRIESTDTRLEETAICR